MGLVTYDAKDPDTTFPPIEPLRPPEGAPNVLIVLLDDAGFGASSAFGGPCHTPTAERLAAGGLKYNRFHTTALCAPTRQALLTGRNHHAVGMGAITEFATSAPGYNSIRPNTAAPLAEMLKLNGYSTAQFGKCHEVPVWQTSPMGPFDCLAHGQRVRVLLRVPRRRDEPVRPGPLPGHHPGRARPTPEEGYHFTDDMADQAIEWVRQQKALMPDKPFFVYFAPGATHAPHHVPKEWSDKYKGQFDQGWDELREEIFARQKELGVIPPDAELTARPRRDPGLGRHAGRAEAGAGAADGGLRRLPGAHRPPGRPADRRAGGPGDPRRHAGLLHHRRQRRLRRGDAQRHVQRDAHAQRGGGARDARVHGGADRQVRHARRPTTTTRSAGRTRWTRPTSGPSRSPRTGAAPATARSCTGPTASRPRARSAPSSTT